LHFHYTTSGDDDVSAPYWFLGEYTGIRKKSVIEELKKSKREVKFVSTNVWFYFWAFFMVCVLLYIPWIIVCTYLNTKWAFQSIGNALEYDHKRRGKRVTKKV
jgi:hypothetical protein